MHFIGARSLTRIAFDVVTEVDFKVIWAMDPAGNRVFAICIRWDISISTSPLRGLVDIDMSQRITIGNRYNLDWWSSGSGLAVVP